MQRLFFGRHYALAVVIIIFTALLAAAGLRSTPGVLMVPWGQAFGWSRQTISFAAAEVLQLYFHDRRNFDVTSESLPGVTRHFNNFADAAEEV